MVWLVRNNSDWSEIVDIVDILLVDIPPRAQSKPKQKEAGY